MFPDEWTVDSWQKYSCLQMPFYPFLSQEVKSVCSVIDSLPALVSVEKIINLKMQFRQLSERKAFLLHCGTCAETFECSTSDYVTRQINMLNILALDIEKKLSKPVIKIARLAGQFGKPRTSTMQCTSSTEILNYFGDIVNQMTPSFIERKPQPENMLHAYRHSEKMIGFADKITPPLSLGPDYCFLSHEALLIPYEASLTRKTSAEDSGWYNLAAHFPWLGKRSLYPESPHIEYMRGIQNPIGIKLSDDMTPDFLIRLIKCLNPSNESSRITLIHRFGVEKVKTYLPRYVQAVHKAALNVIWIVDPMHGNTEILSDGRKFRNTSTILHESVLAANIHLKHDSYLAGIHLECANESILECASHPNDIDMLIPYTSAMDPRLNLQQARDLVDKFIEIILA